MTSLLALTCFDDVIDLEVTLNVINLEAEQALCHPVVLLDNLAVHFVLLRLVFK